MSYYVPVINEKPFDRNKDHLNIHDKIFMIKSIKKAYTGYNFLVVYDANTNTNNYFIGMSRGNSDGAMLLPCRRDGFGNYKLDCSHIIANNPEAFGDETCNLDVAFVETDNGLDIYSINKL